ncbi:immunoglobulin-like domain-containing protein, partial
GQTSGTLTIAANNGEDVYSDASTRTATITGTSGGNFESLQVGTGSATASVSDTIDTVTATLTAGSPVFGAGGTTTITYTVTLTNSDNLAVAPKSDLTFTLETGQTVTIHANQSSASTDVTFAPGSISGTSVHNSISLISGGGQYEHLVPTGTIDTTVNSVPTGGGSVSLTLSEAALDTVLNGSSGGMPADLAAGAVTGSAPDSRGETAQATTGITFTATGETITIAFDNPTGSSWTAPTVDGLAPGYSVHWALSGAQLVGNLFSSTDTNLGAFVRLSLTNTSAAPGQSVTPTVTATLTDNLIDGVNKDAVTIGGIKVVATDASGDKVSGSVNLTITDDAAVAHNVTESTVAGSMSTVNVQLIVDVSYSMYSSYGGGVSNVPGGYTQDRIGLARYSMEQLLESNDQIKYVEIVKFGENASGTVWMTKADALAYIQNNANWNGSGGTNYDLGLQQAMSSYGTGAPVQADKNVVYFLSDGAPSGDGIASGADDGNHTNNSVTTGEWEAFINAKGIDSVYAIGIGGSINVANLEPVSYPNTDGSDGNTTEDTVILVGTSDVTGLLATLQGFLGNAQSVGGNVVIDGGVDASFGADGGHVQSIVVNGVTYSFTPGAIAGTGTVSESGTPAGAYQDHGSWIEIKTALGGTLTFYFTDVGTTHHAGDYSYLAPISNTGNESFAYTIVDGDGDTAGATLAISVTAPPNANPVITAPNNGTDTTNLFVAENTTAVTNVNATDADGNTLVYSIVQTAGTDYAKFAINSSTGVLTFISAPNYEAPGDVGGTAGDNVYVVTVQVSDGHGGVDTQTLNVTVTNANDAPIGSADNIYTNASNSGDGTTLSVQNAWLVANDTDADGQSLNVGSASSGTDVDNVNRGQSATSIRVDISRGNTGSFTYTATDGTTNSANTVVTVNRGSSDSVITGGAGNDILIGSGSTAATLDGGAGRDFVTGGSGNDTIVADASDYLLDGGAGSDTLRVDASFTSGSDAQIVNIENVKIDSSAAVVLDLSNQTENFTITGGTGANTIEAGSGNDVIVVAGDLTSADTIDGGAGNDTLTFTGSSSNTTALNGVTNVESITLGDATTSITTVNSLVAAGQTLTVDGAALALNHALTWNGAAETDGKFAISGGAGNDTITGGAGNDTITGGKGADTLTGGGGSDAFGFAAGDSNLSFTSLSGSKASISGYDVIKDFTPGTTGSADAITFSGGATVAAFATTTDSTYQLHTDATVKSHSISNGIISFGDANTFNSAVTLSSISDVAAVVQYLQNNDIGKTGSTIAFEATIDGKEHTYIFIQGSDDGSKNNTSNPNSSDVLIDLVGVNASSITVSGGQIKVSGSYDADPIVLDLDHNGIALTSQANGVQFDINADGHKDQIAWTAGTDGILAYDVDGNGKIDNGSEIFSPHFAGGSYVDGLAALTTLDSNHDRKIDAADAAFSKLTIWQDLNHNGITDSGELSSLADHSISSISLDASTSGTEINGQSILADGSYTLTDGSTGHFVEVAFDTTLGGSETGSNAYSLIGSDGDDILSGSGGIFTVSGGAGADTFVLDADALNDVKLADVITDYKASEGDTLDVSNLLDSLLGHQASEAEALASVKTTVGGADTVVSVNANGGWHDVAVLQNTTEAVKILYDDKHDATTAPHVG